MKKHLRWSPEELEKLTIGELAELMANIVLILRRMPDVPVADLLDRPASDTAGLVARIRRENTNGEAPENLPAWADEEDKQS
jgi:hypothetical protein